MIISFCKYFNRMYGYSLFSHGIPKGFATSAIDVNTNVAKDVILYKYDNPRFYKFVNIFALSQFGFWSYLSYTSFSTLKNVPVSKAVEEELPWWQKINLGESKYRALISISAFMIGYGILTVCWMYTLRSVRYLVLRKGGNDVTLVTYTPFGHNRLLTVGLNHLSCKGSRTTTTAQLPIKVKNHYLHYILDMRGEFKNQELFDYTAGLKRNWS